MTGIYKIQTLHNSMVYIGSSKHIFKRWKHHLRDLAKNKHGNHRLQNVYNKHGLQDFQFSILQECEQNELLNVEQIYLDKYWDNSYNIEPVAGNGGHLEVQKPVLLINLKGDIEHEFDSGAEAARFLGKSILTYSNINTPAITRAHGRRYRLVHPNFYAKEQAIIRQWPPYSNKTEYELRFVKKYIIRNRLFRKEFSSLREVADHFGFSHQFASYIFRKGYYKKERLYCETIIVDTNCYL